MSSFFDEDDEPRRQPRPRRTRPAGGVATADQQTLLIRRLIAGALIVVFLVLITVAVHSCSASQHKNALKDYTRSVAQVATESSQQVGGGFFKLLGQGTGQGGDLQSAISSFRVAADQQLRQAQGLDVPGDMKAAQQSFLIALEMRRDGLEYIASRISSALASSGDVADRAINEIAGQMQVFLASDVIYETRVVPFMKSALDKNEIGGQEVSQSRFLPSQSWLNPQTIATVLDQQLTSGNRRSGQPTGPGLHGTGLQSTAYGNVTLSPSASNRLTYTPGQAFVVTFTNQGDNDEFDIKVTVRIQAGASQEITLATTIPKVAQGETAQAKLTLNKTPPLDATATIKVNVAPVPGEAKTDNNHSEYPALFTRG